MMICIGKHSLSLSSSAILMQCPWHNPLNALPQELNWIKVWRIWREEYQPDVQLLCLPSNSQGSVGCEVVQCHCYSSVGIGSSYPVKEDVFLLLLLLIHEVYGTPSIYGIEAGCICFVVISFLVLDGLGE